MSICTGRPMRNLALGTAAIVLIAATVTIGGCGSSSDDSPKGPAVGSATPNGGVITVAPEHGRRPHMAGGPGVPGPAASSAAAGTPQ
jgi:hypothetical protein